MRIVRDCNFESSLSVDERVLSMCAMWVMATFARVYIGPGCNLCVMLVQCLKCRLCVSASCVWMDAAQQWKLGKCTVLYLCKLQGLRVLTHYSLKDTHKKRGMNATSKYVVIIVLRGEHIRTRG